jgi:hypothetical protein
MESVLMFFAESSSGDEWQEDWSDPSEGSYNDEADSDYDDRSDTETIAPATNQSALAEQKSDMTATSSNLITPNDDENKNECPICREDLRYTCSEIGMIYPCGHVCHKSCFTDYVTSKTKEKADVICTMCRSTCIDFVRIFLNLDSEILQQMHQKNVELNRELLEARRMRESDTTEIAQLKVAVAEKEVVLKRSHDESTAETMLNKRPRITSHNSSCEYAGISEERQEEPISWLDEDISSSSLLDGVQKTDEVDIVLSPVSTLNPFLRLVNADDDISPIQDGEGEPNTTDIAPSASAIAIGEPPRSADLSQQEHSNMSEPASSNDSQKQQVILGTSFLSDDKTDGDDDDDDDENTNAVDTDTRKKKVHDDDTRAHMSRNSSSDDNFWKGNDDPGSEKVDMKKRVLDYIPKEVQEQYREVCFAEFNGKFFPGIQLGPFDIVPFGNIQDEYVVMAKKVICFVLIL